MVPAAAFFVYKSFPDLTLKFAPTLGPTAALMAALAAFIGALFVAQRASYAQRETAKVVETYKSISQKIWDKDYIEARIKFLSAINSKRNLADFVDSSKLKFLEEQQIQQAINSLANDYETTAIAISYNVIDEEFYKEWFRTSYVQDYIKMMPYINELRRVYNSPDLYKNFESLARAWAKEIPSSFSIAINQSQK